MEKRKAMYGKKGLYSGYDKNHKERQAEDYYSTPTEEVTNILNTLGIDFAQSAILEPCAGGGHMVLGIEDYLKQNDMQGVWIEATDIKDHGQVCETPISTGELYDVLSDNYPITGVPYVIMNPPFSLIEPFIMRMLGIADKGLLVFARLQVLEGEKRYDNILKENPPSDIYVYVDRISCYKNGDVNQKMASAQAYCWLYWDFDKLDGGDRTPKLHWIRRVDKQK